LEEETLEIPHKLVGKRIDITHYIEKVETRHYSNGYLVKFYPTPNIDPPDYRLHFTIWALEDEEVARENANFVCNVLHMKTRRRLTTSSYEKFSSKHGGGATQPIELGKWWGGSSFIYTKSPNFDVEVTMYTAHGKELGTGHTTGTILRRELTKG
jgi:hypothetical protein